jgi:hypothetical protein
LAKYFNTGDGAVAKIVENNLVFRLSKIVKDDDPDNEQFIDEDMLANLEQVVQEIAGISIVVEIVTE